MRPSPRGLPLILVVFSLVLATPAGAQVVINEIMQNPNAVLDSAGEWFELHNAGGVAVDIDGWTIEDAGIDNHVIDNGGPLLIPAGGYLVLGNNADSGTNGGVTVHYSYGSAWFLANGDDELIVLDGAMTEVDRVEYDGGPLFPDPTGASMALISPALDNNVGSNWCTASTAFGAGDLGTPGAANDCATGPADPLINEFVANHTGTDTLEYVEIFGDADTDYSAFTILEVEGDSGATGTIDEVLAVGTTDGGGFWDTGFLDNAIENGSVSLILVETFSGMAGDDLDSDDDGTFDVAPWAGIVDCVAVDDGGASDLTYCATALDSTLPPAGFTPGGASRIPDGADSDTASDWARNDFDGAGIPALDPGTPEEGEAFNTPGATNALVPGEAPDVLINEVDSDQPGTDAAEFVELYDGGAGNTALDGLVLVFYNGATDLSYAAFDLDGLSTGGGGYFVLCGDAANTPNCDIDVSPDTNLIQNGADAVALYAGDAAGFPTNTPVTTTGLIDALVYDTDDPDAAGLLVLLNAAQPQVNEGGAGDATAHSNQRCPDGSGGARNTDTYAQFEPTPGTTNTCGAVVVVINEADADTPGTDVAEFVELFDGGAGNTALDGLVLVLFNGSTDTSYGAVDLDGFSTGADGYFVLCTDAANTPNCDFDAAGSDNLIQNGADAVALYEDDAASFPNGTAVTTTNLIDALVYDTSDADDAGLLVLLNAGQPQVDENGAGDSATDSNQRCPNGSGGPRNTDTYEQWPPTPGAENVCMEVVGPPVCGDTDNVTLIHDVQGTTDASPLAGMVVEVEGIVVGDLQAAGEYGGLFIQEEDADADANPATSEGIFVFTSLPAALHDHVRVRGTVLEFNGLTELSPTTDVVVCSSGATAPTPAMPTLPMPALDAFEAIESMSVVLPQQLVINDTFTVFRFGELTLSSTRRTQPTFVAAPGAPAVAVAEANALDALILDDRRTGQNLAPPINGQDDINPLAADNPIRSGQFLTGLTGVMHYAFNAWRVQPTAPFTIDESGNPRTAAPDPVGGTLKVTGFNVLNFFTTIDSGAPICGPLMNQECRGADSMNEYTRQLDKLVAALVAIDADVAGLIEIENNAGASVQALVDALNAVLGAGTYESIDTGTIGGDVIKQAFIYKPASVTPEGDFALLTSAVDARFDDQLNRPSLAQSFRATDNLALFTVIVNHLKSKGCAGATGLEADQGDGQSCWNPTRTSAAEALRDWANGDPTGTGSDAVLIIGDLNSYRLEDPIATLEAGGFTNQEFAFNGLSSYTFVFDGQTGSLDYALSSVAMTPKVTGASAWAINSDETVSLDYNTEFGVLPSFYAPTAYRSSDHDPIVVGLALNPPSMLTIPTTAPGVDAFIEISGAGDKCGFSAAEFIDPATLSPAPPANLDFPYGVLSFTAENCTPGATATIEVTLPNIPDFLAWLKHTAAGGWTIYPHSLAGNVFSFQVTDGGMGDEDGAANGTIVDPSGPAVVVGGGERATFLVTKDFNDDNPAEVEVTLSCNTGLPLEQSATIAEGEHVEFVLGDFQVGEPDCTVSEAVPDGYAPAHTAGVGMFGIAGQVLSGDDACSFIDVSNGQFTCAVTNTLLAVEIKVFKEWIDENPQFELPQFVEIELSCSEAGFVGAQFIAPGEPGVFSVFPHFDGETCTVSEEQQAGVITDTEDCDGLVIGPGLDAECTVVNTQLYAGIPTLSQYGLAILALLMLAMGFVSVRRQV